MSLAKLRILPSPVAGGRRFEVDCEHATTSMDVFNAPGGFHLTDDMAIATAVARHYLEEHCRCTRKLQLQYLTRRLA